MFPFQSKEFKKKSHTKLTTSPAPFDFPNAVLPQQRRSLKLLGEKKAVHDLIDLLRGILHTPSTPNKHTSSERQ